ncbi:MAG: DEAD/DEAH box helicase [Pseudomonadota bacterium]
MNVQDQATEIANSITFEELPFAPFLKQTIRTVGYTNPTPIQADSIPLILEGRDVIGLAQTGTGKTAAFVLPLLQKLSGSKEKGVRALILAPTRELAEQINDVIKTFAGRTGVRSVTVYGGVSHRNQISQLRANAQIVVACPGRLMDHIRGGTVDLSGVEYLVLDEADRMLDMGFMPDIKSIISELPEQRQTMLFSATMPSEIAELSKSILSEPTTVRVKAEEAVALVTHSMFTVAQESKQEQLSSWVRANPDSLAVVFTKMKHTAKRLGERLSKEGIPAASLHGNLSQAQRQKALQGFRDGKTRVMIATDIASRGIDVEGVTHVINYDMPDTLEAYIHRTGRAGRASRQGEAISFVTRSDRGMVRSIEQWIKTPLIRLNTEARIGDDDKGDAPRAKSFRPRGERSGSDRPRGERSRSDGRKPRERSARGDDRRSDRPDRGQPRRFNRSRDDAPFTSERRSSERTSDRPNKFRGDRPDENRGDREGRRPFRGADERPTRFGRGSKPRVERDGDSRPKRGPSRPYGERGPRAFDSDRPRGERPERSFRGDRDNRGESRRPGQRPRRDDRPWEPRPSRGGEGASRTGDRPARANRSFRGQRDIDHNADYVPRERESHFIGRDRDDSRPRRPRPAGQNRRPRGKARE